MKRAVLAAIVAAGIAQAVFGIHFTHQGATLAYDVQGPAAAGDILRGLIHECEVEGCSQEEVNESAADLAAIGATIDKLELL